MVSEILAGRSPIPNTLLCSGLLQSEKKNADVFVQQMDGIAGLLPETLLAGQGLIIPPICFLFGFMKCPSD